MAFVSPSMKAACRAIVLLHADVIADVNPDLKEEWDFEVKHAQMIRDVRRLALHALEGSLFSSDIAEIEYIYARAQKDVPEELRNLMRPESFGFEQPKKRKPLTFMHVHQLHSPRVVATDGPAAECEPTSWVLLTLEQKAQVQQQQ